MAEEQDQQPQTFKEQLDQEAIEQRKEQAKQAQPQNSIVEKITEYIPAAAGILGSKPDEKKTGIAKEEVTGPPERPHHDDKIEEFVRDQHRSVDDGSLNDV